MNFKRLISKLNHSSILAGSLLGLASVASASVSINIDAEKLKDSSEVDIPVTGMVYLVVDANGDGFSGPSSTAFVQDDDQVVGSWEIASDGGNQSGAFIGTTGAYTMTDPVGAGDPLAFFWFPTLTAADAVPGEAVAYGMYTAAVGAEMDASEAWVMPADGVSAYRLQFLTTDAEILASSGGSEDPTKSVSDELTDGDLPAGATAVVAANNGPLSISLTWTDNADDETGYRIERQTAGGAWELVYTTAANVTSYNDISVDFSTAYIYRVITVRGASVAAVTADATSSSITSEASPARMGNISSRSWVGASAEEAMFAGFYIGGGQMDLYFVATVSPESLGDSALSDPTMEILQLQNVGGQWQWVTIETSDDWVGEDYEQDILDYGKNQPGHDYEPAVVLKDTEPGLYGIVVEGKDGADGITTVGIYDITDG